MEAGPSFGRTRKKALFQLRLSEHRHLLNSYPLALELYNKQRTIMPIPMTHSGIAIIHTCVFISVECLQPSSNGGPVRHTVLWEGIRTAHKPSAGTAVDGS